MKKLIVMMTAFLMLFSLNASDRLVMLGYLSPLASYSGSGEAETVPASSLSHDSAFGLMCTAEFERRGFDGMGLLSGGFNAKNLFDLMMVSMSLTDIELIGMEGTVAFTPDLSGLSDLEASIAVDYSDVEILYSTGARIGSLTIDGRIGLSADFSDESLVYISAATDGLMVNGSDTGPMSVGVKVFYEKDRVSEWLNMMGYDESELRMQAALMMTDIPELAMAGLDASSPQGVLESLEEKDALDVLDAAAFVFIADSLEGMDPMHMVTMSLHPVLYADGRRAEDIDLKALMDDILDIAYAVSQFY